MTKLTLFIPIIIKFKSTITIIKIECSIHITITKGAIIFKWAIAFETGIMALKALL